ncbi:MAG: hypothetical protein CSA65_03525 [Proteobacteria bacterium]|nr:MAG: hypothetical protein CSB49_03335 [Pseudomonadota bacterium]PIE18996.1 MAG: hypothetical protein CSA65_03525 [Pseudomonadota bacterium]
MSRLRLRRDVSFVFFLGSLLGASLAGASPGDPPPKAAAAPRGPLSRSASTRPALERAVAIPTVKRAAGKASPLTLAEVLRSVRALHPKLAQARLKVLEAGGALQAARGGFDPVLTGKGQWKRYDYNTREVVIGMRQPTALWGLSVFGEWSLSGGKFPSYDGDRVTSRGGIARLGVALPLLNGGPIDKRRAKIARVEAKQRGARFAVLGTRLELSRKAARAFWRWVAAGHRLRVDQALLELALVRDKQVAEGVRRGALPAIDRLDNQRAILSRRGGVIKARRRFEKATFKLSLFLRDSRGKTRRVGLESLPAGFPPTAAPSAKVKALLSKALERRPEFGALRARRSQIDVDRRLAKNQRLPKLTLSASGGVDIGAEPYLDERTELKLGLSLRMPLLLRNARGRLTQAQAASKRLSEVRRQLRDRVEAQVRDAVSALQAAHQQVTIAEQELRLARRLEQAERDRLRLGSSTLLVVNLRERSAAKAARKLVDLRARYHQARADVFAVTGTLSGASGPRGARSPRM